MTDGNNTGRLGRRRFLQSTTLIAGGALAAPAILKYGKAMAQDKPAEIIVRAWGGVWLESLAEGVSVPFTDATGIMIRHDLAEDNEVRPKIWAAVDQGRVPPIHVNWDTTTNATKSALRGVTEDLGELANLEGLLPLAKPSGLDGWPLVNT
jgi:putative spermidine/putrescine transport system substrate-binding protein